MKITLLIFLFVSVFKLFPQSHVDIFSKEDPWVEKILSEMTLEEKAGQLVYPHAYGQYMSFDSQEYLRLEHLVENVKVGGIIFFLSRIYDQALITNKLQSLSKIPLLISSDFERGVAQRAENATIFPYNMGVGAADNIELTYQMGKIIAAEGRALGVHQNYAPVSDINNNPYNPIINVRSFGEDVELVKRMSNAFFKGVQDGGMIATSKHFPGHGNTNVDSHRGLPLIEGDKDNLTRIELNPFKSNIDEGVMSFMIGHLEVPAYEPAANLPSSLSRNIVTNLLKDEMGFKGLVVTDAMNMRAITNSYSTAEAAVMALNAGNDLILFPDDAEEAVNAIIAAVKSNELTEQRLNESVRKILIAKKWSGLDNSSRVDVENISFIVGIKPHWDVARNLARESITIVKDDESLIPLSSDSNIKYAHISILDSRTFGADNHFNRLLSKRTGNLKSKTLLLNSAGKDYDEALSLSEDADAVILSIYLKVRAYEGDLGLIEEQAELVKKILALDKPVVLLSHGNPYILAAIPEVKTYLCNYGDTEVSELALAEAIFGENNIGGKLPIAIPETDFKYGHGIVRNKSALREAVDLDSKKFKEIDEVINNAIRESAFPGAVVLVAKDGEVVFEKAFGKFTYDYKSEKVTANTIYDLASVSKVVGTATAAMICVDRNLFSLDDKVVKYIPEFGQNNKEHITIRNLMVHNSGLIPYKRYYKMYDNEEDVLKDIYSSSLNYETGTKMEYSDLGMITLAKIIEKVTGRTLDKFCKEEIFNPLGMTSTFYNPPAPVLHRIAPTEIDNYWRNRLLTGEVHDETAAMLGGVAGHAGLFSTAGDLAKFLQMLLQKGNYQGRQIIKPETVEMFIKKQSALSTRGLGWDTKSPQKSSAGNLFSEISYGHTGYTGTSVWTDPAKNLFVVFLTNRVHPTRENSKIISVRPRLHNAVVKALEQ